MEFIKPYYLKQPIAKTQHLKHHLPPTKKTHASKQRTKQKTFTIKSYKGVKYI